ncbi:hypothetical protein BCR36DRAFT_588563 [Piromyces finnis]|uniref:RING-type E3 ubiquitin transferase n=1 Tax=Piromyces finnis TaxID=1754191 RepID=A0A1Y1U8I4_9FUNG|nr:hypothetical protein BCR36DRAFT_588563 [Piromyces finnis]|eukprot:ORX34333.1 hypothetical protein BCR36DRAFT_588563 [Piromyces finnis]
MIEQNEQNETNQDSYKPKIENKSEDSENNEDKTPKEEPKTIPKKNSSSSSINCKKKKKRLISCTLSLDDNANDNAVPLFDYLVNCWRALCEISDNIEEIFDPILKYIMDEMNKQNLNKNYLPPLNAVSKLLTNKLIAAIVPTLNYWNPESVTAKEIEDKTFLGVFYSKVSAFPDSDSGISQAYFSNRNSFSYSTAYENNINGFEIGSRNPDDVKASQNSLCSLVENVQSTLFSMTMSIIRAGLSSREAVLKFFGDTITKNQSREKIQIDRKEVSTDGLMYSLTRVCHKLCEPFLDPGYKKIGLIDLDYFSYTKRIDITEHTRILFDLNQSKEYSEKWNKEHPETPKPNFVTEMFYLTMAVYHYGFLSTVRFYQRMVSQIEEIRKQVKKMNAEKNSGVWANLGIRRVVNEQLLIRYQTQLDVMIDHKLAMDAILLNKTILVDVFKFYNLVMTWIIKLILNKSGMVASTTNINWAQLSRGDISGNIDLRKLPDEAPDAFKALPEWIIDDICEFLVFVCRNKATIFEVVSRDELMTFIMVLMNNSNYIKNPYLKAKFAEILSCFTVPLYRDALGHTSGHLNLIFEMHPLAKDLLVEDMMKFYIDIEQTGMHSQFYDKFNIRYILVRNTEFFVHFANLLMNDTTYLLDEALAKLSEIHVIQKEMTDAQNWNSKTDQYRSERENLLRMDERQAISYMSLGNETVHMLNYMTNIYIHLSNRQEFINAVARDGHPLLYTLMDDPVILPTSHQTVDRSTIKSHLLSDSHDPFNRQPLTIDMVTPNVELKAKIDAYKKERQQKKNKLANSK